LDYLHSNIKYDYIHGGRELNLDMNIRDAEMLFAANDKIKGMAETGEL